MPHGSAHSVPFVGSVDLQPCNTSGWKGESSITKAVHRHLLSLLLHGGEARADAARAAEALFLDETGTTTKMTRMCGRCLKGQRLRSKAPFGHWKTQTFSAGLRCYGLTAPFVVDRPMKRRILEIYVEIQLAPALSPGDVVILDNLAAHKSPRAEAAIRGARGMDAFPAAVQPPISTRSRWHSQSSRRTRALAPSAPSTVSGKRRHLPPFSATECRNYFNVLGYDTYECTLLLKVETERVENDHITEVHWCMKRMDLDQPICFGQRTNPRRAAPREDLH